MTKTQKLKSIIAAAAILGIAWACNPDEASNPASFEAMENENPVKTKLGRKLENPYSVTNMKTAWENLSVKSNGRTSGDIEIKATHYYVKFFPQSRAQVELLGADSLELFSYPIDYELDSLGDYYSEGEAELTEGQWYWTAVPVDYEFPAVEHEIIEELFLVDELEQAAETAGRTAFSTMLLELEDEALRITGNWEEREDGSSNSRRAEIHPQGTIRVWNTMTNSWEGVVGVKVRTHRWFKWGHGWTDAQGGYRVNKAYKRDVHYSIQFENRAGFKLWDQLADLNPVEQYRGGPLNIPKYDRSGWDKDFSTEADGWRFATVNNAVVKYLDYCDQFSIGKPHSDLRIVARRRSNGVGATPMLRRIWGLHGFTTNSQVANFFSKSCGISTSTNSLQLTTKFVQPDIILNAGFANDNQTDNVYATAFHELGHASHMRQAGSAYWVKYVNYIITYGNYLPVNHQGFYGDGTGKNAGYCGVGEMWGNYVSAVYMDSESPLGAGPADYLSETEDWYNPGFLLDVDNISDVATSEIFICLTPNTNSFSGLVNQFKTKTENDAQVDSAFANYNDWP